MTLAMVGVLLMLIGVVSSKSRLIHDSVGKVSLAFGVILTLSSLYLWTWEVLFG